MDVVSCLLGDGNAVGEKAEGLRAPEGGEVVRTTGLPRGWRLERW